MSRKPPPDANSARHAPNEQDPAGADQDADWGFAKAEKERVLDPRLGLVLVTCLVLMFGFVLYHKYQSLQNAAGKEALAGGAAPSGSDDASPTTASESGEDRALSGAATPSEPTPTLAQSSFASTPSAGDPMTSDPFGATSRAGSATNSAGSDPPPQSEPSLFGDSPKQGAADTRTDNFSDADPFFTEAPPAPDRSASPPSPAEWDFGRPEQLAGGEQTAPDPFAASAETGADESGSSDWETAGNEPQTLDAPELAMPLPAPPADPDPFSQGAAPTATAAGDWEPNPFGTAAATNSPDREPTDWPSPEGSQNLGERTQPTVPALEAPSFAAPSSQQITAARGDWNLNSVSNHVPDGAGEQVIGERHLTITRRDSLWSISQDAYGTARYVPALSRYNQNIVPHPDKLPLGVHILIPPPEVLEARFPDLFQRTAHRDAMISPAGGAASGPSQPSPSGMFLDAAGTPYYRADKSDTLTRIAQRYLGRASRWTEILAMNRDRLQTPESLKPGMVLRMPADAARVSVLSDQPSSR